MKKRIMLDAGHYGKRNQSPILPEYYESERMWLLCELLAKELSVLGFEVFKTRESLSKDLAVVERGKMAADCDLFLSLHSNATGNEALVYGPGATVANALGTNILEQLTLTTGLRNRGIVYRPGLYVLKETEMPAVA